MKLDTSVRMCLFNRAVLILSLFNVSQWFCQVISNIYSFSHELHSDVNHLISLFIIDISLAELIRSLGYKYVQYLTVVSCALDFPFNILLISDFYLIQQTLKDYIIKIIIFSVYFMYTAH